MTTEHKRMRQLQATEADWMLHDPTLLDGEIAFSSDRQRYKVGPGQWSTLNYWSGVDDGDFLSTSGGTIQGNLRVEPTQTDSIILARDGHKAIDFTNDADMMQGRIVWDDDDRTMTLRTFSEVGTSGGVELELQQGDGDALLNHSYAATELNSDFSIVNRVRGDTRYAQLTGAEFVGNVTATDALFRTTGTSNLFDIVSTSFGSGGFLAEKSSNSAASFISKGTDNGAWSFGAHVSGAATFQRLNPGDDETRTIARIEPDGFAPNDNSVLLSGVGNARYLLKSGATIESTQPTLSFSETDEATEDALASMLVSGGDLYLRAPTHTDGRATVLRLSGGPSDNLDNFLVRKGGAWQEILHAGNVQADPLDVTPGALLAAGAFGWGDTGATVPNSNIDDIAAAGQYSLTSATISGSPALADISLNSGSSLLNLQFNATNTSQILIAHPSGRVYTRINDGGGWSDFSLVADGDKLDRSGVGLIAGENPNITSDMNALGNSSGPSIYAGGSTANKPFGRNGAGQLIRGWSGNAGNFDAAGEQHQVFFPRISGSARPEMFLRSLYPDNTWSDWSKITAERGSNANGDYVRFADGTQICTQSETLAYSATSAGSVYRDNSLLDWTYPAAFVAKPTATFSTGSVGGWGETLAGLTSSRRILFRISAASGDVDVTMSAVGRWF